MGGKSKEPSFGEGLVEGLREVVAWKRGEVALEVVNIEPVATTQVLHRPHPRRPFQKT